LSQPALGWLKVCYDVDKHLSLPSLYGCRLAIGYFRGGERGVRAIRAFVVSFGGHSLLLCFGGFSSRSRLYVGWPAGGEDCSLDPLWSYAHAPVFKRAKIGLIRGL
jgi:hypothetical protein